MFRFSCFIGLVLICTLGSAADWQHWRGPTRNGVGAETSGWDGRSFVKGELWKFSAGEGSAAPLVVGDNVYLTGWRRNRDSVICLDAVSGEEKWRQTYASPKYGRFALGDQGLYSGACSTPEYDTETQTLFTLGIDGALNAWDTKQRGKRGWGLNIYDRYQAKRRPEVAKRRRTQRDYGYTTAPLVMGSQIIVEVGGNKGNLVAFDKRTGKELWTSANRDEAGHTGGPVPITVQGVQCVAVLTLRNLVVTRTDGSRAGQTVAVFPWTTDFGNNIPTPAVFGDSVIITSSYNHKSMCRVRITLRGATKVWENIEIQSAVCSPVIHEGRIYWAWQGVHCADFETGRELWAGGSNGTPGSCIVTSDDRLIVYGDNGNLSLVETTKRSATKFTQLAMARVLSRTDAWPHVVLANGRVFCRDRSGAVRCLAVSSAAAKMKVNVTSKPTTPKPFTRPAKLDLSNWPGKNDPTLFYAWKRGIGQGTPMGTLASQRPKLVRRDRAKFDADGRMDVKDGSFHLQGAAAPLLKAAKQSNELTIETIATTPDLRQVGPARMITFSTDGFHRNFTLAQERDQLLLRLRTPRTGENGMKPQSILGRIQPQKPVHILVTYRDGEVVCYLNGERSYKGNNVSGNFSNWDDRQQLVFGAEYQDGRSWNGVFDGIALLTRFVGPEEARKRYQAALGGRPTKPRKVSATRGPTSSPSPSIPVGSRDRVNLSGNAKPRQVSLPFRATLRAGSAGHENGIAELSIRLDKNTEHLKVATSRGKVLRHQWMPAIGSLLVEVPGQMSAGSTENIVVTAASSSASRNSDVRISDAGVHEESESWRIQTAVGSWYFSKSGGGFGSLDDVDGKDWINYHPRGGSAGNYRGLPNLVHPEGIFHAGSGKTKCKTTVVASGPLAVSLLSETTDGKWAMRYDIFKHHVRCTVVKAAHAYWFLYEGTPGGKLDLDGNDFVLRDDLNSSARESWQGRSHEWVAFGDRRAGRSLILVHQSTDNHQDSYWQMQGNMTVFGFGRLGLDKFMTAAPNAFYVQLEDSVSTSQLRRIASQLGNPIMVVWPL